MLTNDLHFPFFMHVPALTVNNSSGHFILEGKKVTMQKKNNPKTNNNSKNKNLFRILIYLKNLFRFVLSVQWLIMSKAKAKARHVHDRQKMHTYSATLYLKKTIQIKIYCKCIYFEDGLFSAILHLKKQIEIIHNCIIHSATLFLNKRMNISKINKI